MYNTRLVAAGCNVSLHWFLINFKSKTSEMTSQSFCTGTTHCKHHDSSTIIGVDLQSYSETAYCSESKEDLGIFYLDNCEGEELKCCKMLNIV